MRNETFDPFARADARADARTRGVGGARGDARLRNLRAIARWLDEAFQVPGTRFRIGLDPILGVVPGLGDVAPALVAAYVFATAFELGVPASVLARLAANIVVDAAVGAIPFLGDLFDFGWKASSRNVRLLEGWLERPAETRRRSRVAVTIVLVLVLAVIAAVVFAVWSAVVWAVNAART